MSIEESTGSFSEMKKENDPRCVHEVNCASTTPSDACIKKEFECNFGNFLASFTGDYRQRNYSRANYENQFDIVRIGYEEMNNLVLPRSYSFSIWSKACGRRSWTAAAMEEHRVVSKPWKSVVLYHYPCPDGVFAALAAHLYHAAVGRSVSFLPNTVYKPLRAEDLSTENVETFYLLDFAGPQGFAVELAKRAKEVVVLDHHKTALETLPPNGIGPPNLQILLDMERSGATIAYDYFFQKLQAHSPSHSFLHPEKAPHLETLFKYIQDADLWTWALPDSKAFSSGLVDSRIEYSVPKNTEVFDQLLALDPEVLIKKGKASLLEKQKHIDQALENSFAISLGLGKFGQCLAVRADSVANLRSELGNQLAAKSGDQGLRPIGAVVYVEEALSDASMFKISLRSIGDADDTTQVSQTYGGGGHRNASSFLLSKSDFETWKA